MLMRNVDLDQRIADALAGKPTSAELGQLLDEALIADETAQSDLEAAKNRALDPATPPAAVTDARKAMEDAQFRRDRLAVGAKRLGELQTAAVKAEQDAIRAARRAEVIAERDALAAELRKLYPAVSQQLANLLGRIGANTEQLQLARLPSEIIPNAEDVARGVISRDVTSLVRDVRLPVFEPQPFGAPYLWPFYKEVRF